MGVVHGHEHGLNQGRGYEAFESVLSLDVLDGELGLHFVGQGVLVHVQSSDAKSDIVFKLRREPFLHHVVAALHVEVVESARVPSQQIVGILGNERYPKQAAQVVGAGSSGDPG